MIKRGGIVVLYRHLSDDEPRNASDNTSILRLTRNIQAFASVDHIKCTIKR